MGLSTMKIMIIQNRTGSYLKRSLVIVRDKVDRNSLTAEPYRIVLVRFNPNQFKILVSSPSTTSNPVDVVLPVGRQVVVDDQGDLLHVDTTGQQICGDQHPGGATAELAHDHVPLLLVHVAVHGGHREVALVHLLSQPVHLPPGVAEDDRLGDGESLVEIAKGVKLPLLSLHRDVELPNTLEGQLLLLDKDANGVPHEPGRDLQHLLGHRSRQKNDLLKFAVEDRTELQFMRLYFFSQR